MLSSTKRRQWFGFGGRDVRLKGWRGMLTITGVTEWSGHTRVDHDEAVYGVIAFEVDMEGGSKRGN